MVVDGYDGSWTLSLAPTASVFERVGGHRAAAARGSGRAVLGDEVRVGFPDGAGLPVLRGARCGLVGPAGRADRAPVAHGAGGWSGAVDGPGGVGPTGRTEATIAGPAGAGAAGRRRWSYPRLRQRVLAGQLTCDDGQKVATVLGQAARNIDQADGLIDRQPAGPVLDAILYNTLDLIRTGTLSSTRSSSTVDINGLDIDIEDPPIPSATGHDPTHPLRPDRHHQHQRHHLGLHHQLHHQLHQLHHPTP